jgi:hypothetical protein
MAPVAGRADPQRELVRPDCGGRRHDDRRGKIRRRGRDLGGLRQRGFEHFATLQRHHEVAGP